MPQVARCFGLLLLLAAVGCTKEEDYLNVMREQRAALKETADVLETVKDEKSMAEAQKSLAGKIEKYDAIVRRAKSLPNPPPPEVAERMNQQKFFMEDAVRRLQTEVKRVSELPGGKAFLKQFESSSPGLLTAVHQ